jgi:hypothetical protein
MDPTGTLGEAFEVRSLCVHLVFWAANPHLLNASIHCSHSQHLDTQNQRPLILTTFWDTGFRSTDIKLPLKPLTKTTSHAKTTDLWLQIPPFTSTLQQHDADRIPSVMQAPTNTQTPFRCSNPKPRSPTYAPTTFWDSRLRSTEYQAPMKPLTKIASHAQTTDLWLQAPPVTPSLQNNILLPTILMQSKTPTDTDSPWQMLTPSIICPSI